MGLLILPEIRFLKFYGSVYIPGSLVVLFPDHYQIIGWERVSSCMDVSSGPPDCSGCLI